MDNTNNFEKLVNTAIEMVTQKYPGIRRPEFKIENITPTKLEKLLWYLLDTYYDVQINETVSQMIIESASHEGTRTIELNKFLKDYFANVIADAEHSEALDVENITEEKCKAIFNYLIENYQLIWKDETFLRGVALFAKTEREGN